MASRSNLIVRALLIGVVAGMRSQYPLALIAISTRSDHRKVADGRAGFLETMPALIGFGLAAVGELVGDKLPFTPSRLNPGSLAVRALTGGAAGAILARRAGAEPVIGAIAGSAGSAVGSYAGYHLRTGLDRVTGIPDPFWGGVEDVIAIGLGLTVVHTPR